MVFDRREHAGAAVPTVLTGQALPGDTSLDLDDVTGWPDGATGPFWVTLGRGTGTEEKVLATARVGNQLTGVTRGQDGTSPQTHAAQATAEHGWSAVEADEANVAANTLLGTSLTKGQILGTPGGQAVQFVPAPSANGEAFVSDDAATQGAKWGQVGTTGLEDGSVTEPKLGDGSVTNAKLEDMGAGEVKAAKVAGDPTNVPLLPKEVLIGHTVDGLKAVTIGGDVAVDEEGDAQIQPNVVTNVEAADMVEGTMKAGKDGGGDPQDLAVAAAEIPIGTAASGIVPAVLSGDVAMDETGDVTIQDDTITAAMLTTGAIDAAYDKHEIGFYGVKSLAEGLSRGVWTGVGNVAALWGAANWDGVNVFTAPADGLYTMTWTVAYGNPGEGGHIRVSNSNAATGTPLFQQSADSGGDTRFCVSGMAQMLTGDTLTYELYINGTGTTFINDAVMQANWFCEIPTS